MEVEAEPSTATLKLSIGVVAVAETSDSVVAPRTGVTAGGAAIASASSCTTPVCGEKPSKELHLCGNKFLPAAF